MDEGEYPRPMQASRVFLPCCQAVHPKSRP